MSPVLLMHSLTLATLVTCVSLVIGVLLAVFRSGLHSFWQKSFDGLALIVLMTPPFIYADGWMVSIQSSLTGMEIFSLLSCAVVESLGLWPVAYILMQGFWKHDSSTTQALTCGISGWSYIWCYVLPRSRRWLMMASMIVFVSSWNSLTVPSLFNIRVLSSWVWMELNSGNAVMSILGPSLVHGLIPALVFFFVYRLTNSCWTGNRVTPISPAGFRHVLGFPLFSMAGMVGIWGLAMSLGFGALPVLGALMNPSAIGKAYQSNLQPVWTSISVAGMASILTIGVSLCVLRWRWLRILWVAWFIPGISISLVISWLLASTVSAIQYTWGAEIVVLAIFLRIMPLGILAMHTDPHQIPIRRVTEYYKTAPLSWPAWIRWVAWPVVRPRIAWLMLILIPLSLWEVEAPILIIPPGGETAAMRVFGLLHYGHTGMVHGICAILAIVAILVPAGIHLALSLGDRWPIKNIWKIGTPLILGLAALTTGCQPDNHDSQSQNHFKLPDSQAREFFEAVTIIGGRGNGAGLFQKPRSLAVMPEGEVFVADMTGRIQRFGSDGHFECSWQLPEVELGRPKGMGIDVDGWVMVIEPHYGRINHFSRDGELMKQWGIKGREPGELDLPRSILPVGLGTGLLVSEFGGHDRLQWFDPAGQFTGRSTGSAGSLPGQLNRPEGLAELMDGSILVADSNNHRIQTFSKKGDFLETHGQPGTGPGEFSYPFDVLVDSHGYIFVCEFGNSRIQILSPQWIPIAMLGSLGRQPGQFFNPWDMAFDADENLYVADAMNHRIQKFLRNSHRKKIPRQAAHESTIREESP